MGQGTERWEHFPHGADIGVRGLGGTPAAAFEQAALALTAIVADPGSIRPLVPVEVACEAPDLELLFVDWLNALVYEMATREMLFARYEVHISGSMLEATAWGEAVAPEQIELAVEPKGATYTALAVRREPDGTWVAQCVVDV